VPRLPRLRAADCTARSSATLSAQTHQECRRCHACHVSGRPTTNSQEHACGGGAGGGCGWGSGGDGDVMVVVVVVGENFGWTWMTARWTNWEMDDLGAGWETTDLEDE
jgi:hypothetical protein